MGPHVVAFSSDRKWMDAFNPGLADRAADPDNRTRRLSDRRADS